MKQTRIVVSVERTPVSSLSGMVRVSGTLVILPQGIVWTPLEIKPHAHLTISNKVEDKVPMWTARLSFKTCEDVAGLERQAFLCRLSNGECRLIGDEVRPYPVVSVTESMPENVTENQLNEVVVEWKSSRSIVDVM